MNHPQLIDHPAAWQGDELFSRSDWLQQLTDDDQQEIEQIAQHGDEVPLAHLSEHFSQIQHQLEHGSGACLVQGLRVKQFTEEQNRRIFWALVNQLGTPVSQSAKGEHIFSVRDEGYKIGQPQARGPNTSKRLSFHTDRCDVISFLCLQPAAVGGNNQIVSSMTLYNEMQKRRPDLVQVLMQPFYYQRHNVDTGNERPWCQQPIFSFHEGHFAASYLRVLLDRAYALPELPDLTPTQLEALSFLEELAQDPTLHVTFRLEAGEMLFLNNWVTFHRRDKFEDTPEPELRRHLLRVWLAVPNSRPLAPAFADNYGSTEAGAIRGGMRQSQ